VPFLLPADPTQSAIASSSGTAAAPTGFGRALNPQDGAGGGAPEGDKYVINVKQHAKYVVGLGDRVSPTDVEEGMRVG
jgi:26S proteasome regulatory subunit T1